MNRRKRCITFKEGREKTMIEIYKMAWRNLNRNRRRAILSALAVSLGLALLMLIAGILRGEMESSVAKTIQLVSGHVQVRSVNYVEGKSSLKWADLIEDPQAVIGEIESAPQLKDLIQTITPRLYASAIVSSGDTSVGVQLIGIDPLSPANAPFIEGLTAGEFLTPEDGNGIYIGQLLAEKLKAGVGDQVSLLANTSNGDVNEQSFTIRGLYTTHTPSYDESTVFMPLTKAQAMTTTQNHASALFILLKDRAQSLPFAAAVRGTDFQTVTWEDMNQLLLETENLANSFMIVIYLIVLGVTATVVVNTLIMAVFERTREIGILAAIGMKSRKIMGLFLAEASLMAAGGVAFGILLGWLVCLYFGKVGFGIGNLGVRNGIMLGDRLYALLTWNDVLNLSIVALVVTMIASFFPARTAARLEPVDALHGK
jgi:ABC-type lipoprotein release transport system permease subunit